MTDTKINPTETADSGDPRSGADKAIDSWLAEFDSALSANDVGRAAELFEADGFWRDFVAFTWNLKTMEGRDDIRDMLTSRLADVRPRNWRRDDPANADSGVIDGWVTFETDVARGWAHLRLRDGKAWTLLTTMQELKGFEERKGRARDKGVDHVITRERKTWLERRREVEETLGYSEQPYVVIIGGGQGRHRARRAA